MYAMVSLMASAAATGTIRPGSVIQAGGGAAAAAPKPLEESTNRVVEPIYPEQKEPALAGGKGE